MQKSFFFYGDDRSLISEKVREIKISVNNNVFLENLSVKTLDELDNFINNGTSVSLFAKNQVLIIELSFKLFKSLLSDSQSFIDYLSDIVKSKTVVLIVYIEKFDKVTQRLISDSTFLSTINSLLYVQPCLKIKPWENDKLEKMISNLLIKHSVSFDDDARSFFTNYVSNQLGFTDLNVLMRQVVDFVFPLKKVKLTHLQQLFSVNLNIDSIFNLIVNKKFEDFFSTSMKVQSSINNLYLISVLQSKLRRFLLIKILLSRNIGIYQISQILNENSYKIEQESKSINSSSIEYLYRCSLKSPNLMGNFTEVIFSTNFSVFLR